AAHRDDYRPPARLSFWHVFLASAVHGGDATREAEAILARLRAGTSAPADGARLGDSFVVPPHVVAQSPAQVAKLFGPAFASTVQEAEAGAWIGPVASPFGVHLVWIEAREPGAPPGLDAVKGQVLERWQDEQRTRRQRELVRELERRYPLRVESAAWRSRSTS